MKLKVVEDLSEGCTPLSVMRDAVEILDTDTYDDLIIERWSESLCPYAACGNECKSPYKPASESSLRLSLKGNNLYGGKKGTSPFCSTVCEHRSEWYRGMVGTKRRELLEDVEIRRREFGYGGNVIGTHQSRPEEVTNILLDEDSNAPTPFSSTNTPSNFEIRENETPLSAPTAPSSSSIDFERHLPSSSSNPMQTLSRKRPSPASHLASSSSSLLPFDTTSLTRTLLKASATLSSSASTVYSQGGKPGEPRFITAPVMMEDGVEVEWNEEEEMYEEGEEREAIEGAWRERGEALKEAGFGEEEEEEAEDEEGMVIIQYL